MLKSALTLTIALTILGFTSPVHQADNHEAATGPELGNVIEVSMSNFSFSPDKITVPAGKQVTIKLTNNGSVPHEFHVGKNLNEGSFESNLFKGVQVNKSKGSTAKSGKGSKSGTETTEGGGKMLKLKPGQSGSLTFTLPKAKKGTYTIACLNGSGDQAHYKKGMKGTLIVK